MTPELPSEPPHSIARLILEAGCLVRVHSFASGSNWWTAATAASTVLLIPLAPGYSGPEGEPARPVCRSS